jgi:uncharacterized protein with GYD domain
LDDKTALKTSSAGMRLIAQTTIFNQGDFARLRTYITDNYHDAILAEVPASTRLAEQKAIYRMAGKLRVEQVVAAGKHQVVVIMEAERSGRFLVTMTVEEDYPHKVRDFNVQAMVTNS